MLLHIKKNTLEILQFYLFTLKNETTSLYEKQYVQLVLHYKTFLYKYYVLQLNLSLHNSKMF